MTAGFGAVAFIQGNYMRMILIALASTLACSVFAQDASFIEREKPRYTPNEMLAELAPGATATWKNGYITGQTLATVKLLELLYQMKLTNLPVCIPAEYSNGTVTSVLRDHMNSVLLPQFYSDANKEDWNYTPIIWTAIASLQRFPCR